MLSPLEDSRCLCIVHVHHEGVSLQVAILGAHADTILRTEAKKRMPPLDAEKKPTGTDTVI